jgi:hypothetical protein
VFFLDLGVNFLALFASKKPFMSSYEVVYSFEFGKVPGLIFNPVRPRSGLTKTTFYFFWRATLVNKFPLTARLFFLA